MTGSWTRPLFEFNVNLFGPAPQYTLANTLRYEPRLAVDLLLDLRVPPGEYSRATSSLNMGMNCFSGRIGVPIGSNLVTACCFSDSDLDLAGSVHGQSVLVADHVAFPARDAGDGNIRQRATLSDRGDRPHSDARCDGGVHPALA